MERLVEKPGPSQPTVDLVDDTTELGISAVVVVVVVTGIGVVVVVVVVVSVVVEG